MLRDYKKYQRDCAQMNIICQPGASDMTKWEVVMFGPDDTDWQGGIFKLLVEFPKDYP